MKNPVFIAVNTRFNHTNLAIRSLASYVYEHTGTKSLLVEKTIAEPFPVLLRCICDSIGLENTDKTVLLFLSVYIWNAPLMYDLVREVKKIFPSSIIGCGGPEVSYNASEVFSKAPDFDFIIRGEGEETVKDCVSLFNVLSNDHPSSLINDLFITDIRTIPGIYVKNNSDGEPFFTGERELLCSLDALVFPYPSLKKTCLQPSLFDKTETKSDDSDDHLPFIDLVDPKLHIFYYESSRGCPFRCSYCLSSIDKTVRFLSLERVYEDMQVFLNAGVSLVKFVDRTFNLNKDRYLSIWKYIIEHHNGITMFHFEIAAEQFTDVVMDFLQTVPEGVMQFEVGVQTMNPQTLSAIHRPFNKLHLESIIHRIPKTIHLHLDLIAGLPYEDLASFRSSFDQTIVLKPDMLQLGFLKILHGTEMEQYAKSEKAYKWLSTPPYEVLQSSSLSYAHIIFLKDIELLNDVYYNSGNFKTICYYLIDKGFSVFDFLCSLVDYFRSRSILETKHTVKTFASLLNDWLHTDPDLLSVWDIFSMKELLRFDFLRLGKPGSIPEWFTRNYSKDSHHKALLSHTEMKSTRESYSYSEYDEFEVHPYTFKKEKTAVLFLYPKPQEGVKGLHRIVIL